MTRKQVVATLAQDGYQPFLRPFVGSVVAAEAWASKERAKRMVIILYRKDTGEMIDMHNLPDDEENRSDMDAFLDDFRESVFSAP
jgi:hypothetical protein